MKNSTILTPFYLDEAVPGLEALADPGWHINKPDVEPAETLTFMAQLYRPLSDFVAKTAADGSRPVSIAGDCCTSIGILAGLQRAGIDPVLIWFDAHGDFNTWETTPSGFLGGMPLAMLTGRGDQTLVEGVGLRPLPDRQIILTDGRDLDPGERDLLEASQITHVARVEALPEVALPDRPIYVHFDVDVINPDEAPAMNYRTPGGPSVVTLRQAFQYLAASGRVVAVSLSSWNPDLDEDGRSRRASMGLLEELLV